MFDISGKTAFITGGCSGIGLAIARAMTTQGCQVICADIRNHPDDVNTMGMDFVFCDVSKEQSIIDGLSWAAQTKASLDIVILNAGIGDVGPKITETDSRMLERITSINYWGVFYGLKHAPTFMNDSGSIIVTSSMASKINIPGTAAYSAAKASINSLVAMSALELGERNIRVNAVCPGYVDTPLGNSDAEVKMTKYFTALGRHANPDKDIAGVFLFLCMPASQYITGQSLAVDGGWSCGPTERLLQHVTGEETAPGS